MVTVLDLTPITQLTREQFYALCHANPSLPLERSPTGALIIMAPVGGASGNREADLISDLTIWNRQIGLGYVFSSSTLFSLPGGRSLARCSLSGSQSMGSPLSRGTRELSSHLSRFCD